MSILFKLKESWSKMHDEHRAIGKGMLSVAIFMFVARLIGAFKEIIVAWRYGANSEIDAYLYVWNLINLPISIWYSLISVVLIPLYAKLKLNDNKELSHFRSEFYGFTILVSVAVAVGFALIFRSEESLSDFGGLPLKTARIASQMVIPLALLAPLGFFISLFSTETMARKHHANTLLEGFPPLVLGLFLIIYDQQSFYPLIWGSIVGFGFQMLFLGIYLHRLDGLPLPCLTFKSSSWFFFRKAFGIMLLGQVIMAVTGVIDQLYAAGLSEGTIAELGYANRLLGLILSLGATTFSRAALPVLSVPIIKDKIRRRHLVGHWAAFLFLIGVLAFALLCPLAPIIVRMLYERGAFTARNTVQVVSIFRWGLLQIPFYFAGLVYVAQVAATNNYVYLTIVAVISLVVKIAGNSIAIPYLGVAGLMLSTSVMYLITTCIFWALIKYYFPSKYSSM